MNSRKLRFLYWTHWFPLGPPASVVDTFKCQGHVRIDRRVLKTLWVHKGCVPQSLSRMLVSDLLCYHLQPEPVSYWDPETDGVWDKIEKDGCSRWNRAKRVIFRVSRKIRQRELAVSLRMARTEGNRIAERFNCTVAQPSEWKSGC